MQSARIAYHGRLGRGRELHRRCPPGDAAVAPVSPISGVRWSDSDRTANRTSRALAAMRTRYSTGGTPVVRRSASRYGQAGDEQCGRRQSAPKLQVGADHFEVIQNLAQVAGDGDFLDGVGELAVFNP